MERPNMTPALMLACLLAVAGCGTTQIGGPLADDSFGHATRNAELMMTGQSGARDALAQRFMAQVPNTVFFTTGSAKLDEAAKITLNRQANWIKSFPEVWFSVYGHTDLVGSEAANSSLGDRRAKAVIGYLTGQGVNGGRLKSMRSFGESRPLVPTPSPNAQNRRAVTEVAGIVAGTPTVMNGRYADVIFRSYVAGAGTSGRIDQPSSTAPTPLLIGGGN